MRVDWLLSECWRSVSSVPWTEMVFLNLADFSFSLVNPTDFFLRSRILSFSAMCSTGRFYNSSGIIIDYANFYIKVSLSSSVVGSTTILYPLSSKPTLELPLNYFIYFPLIIPPSRSFILPAMDDAFYEFANLTLILVYFF